MGKNWILSANSEEKVICCVEYFNWKNEKGGFHQNSEVQVNIELDGCELDSTQKKEIYVQIRRISIAPNQKNENQVEIR